MLLLFGVRVVYERYLLARNTLLYELVFKVVIGIEVCTVHIVLKPYLRRGQITEHDLRSSYVCRIRPDFIDTLSALVDLTALFVLTSRNETARIKRELFAVRSDFEHIVDMTVHASAVNSVRTIGDFFCEFDRRVRRFQIDHLTLRFGNIQLDHIRGLNVRKSSVEFQKFRKVRKFCKACSRSVALSGRRKFHARHSFTEVCRPTVKERDTKVFQR